MVVVDLREGEKDDHAGNDDGGDDDDDGDDDADDGANGRGNRRSPTKIHCDNKGNLHVRQGDRHFPY
jgi:hypothetical protein